MRLALNSWVGYSLLYLAQDLGLPTEADVRLVSFPSNTAALLALANGDVEAAALTLDELLLAREGGLPLQTVLVFDESHGADALMAQPDITQPSALRGRRIGVESTAVGALMLSQTLMRAGVPLADIVKVSLPADQHVRAFTDKSVDAVVTFEPMATQLQVHGAKRLMDSSQFPGLILDVLAVRADLNDAQTAKLKQALRGHFLALKHLQTQPEAAAAVLAQYQKVPAEDVLLALRGIRLASASDNLAWLGGPNPRLQASAQLVGRLMQQAQLLHHPPDLRQLSSARCLPESA
ncbi:MAG: hypothetical protein RI907_3917 [Pseudomonadota bacterium]